MFRYIGWVVLFIIAVSCKNEVKEVHIDEAFTKRFQLNGGGFTGADGTYSVLLPDGRTVWIFGDTFLGTVTPELTREKTDPLYIRNCFLLDNGDSLVTLHQGKPEEFKSMLIPPIVTKSNFEINERQYWYWPGDGYVQNNQLKVFASEFHATGDGMWDFEFMQTAIITYSLPDLAQVSIDSVPYSNALGVHYGHAVCKTDSFVYVYGLHEGNPYAARIDSKNRWSFLNNKHWSSDPSNTKPMIEINGSEQFSIFAHEDTYIMIMQEGFLSGNIFSYISDTPYGPWRNKKLLYTTPKEYENDQLFTYNALAHPQFDKNDELLISYNTNSFRMEDHYENAGIYRPRFIRVPYSLILNEND